jgi:Cof subfamily protein (haloacid dehalogenase superfamily)
LCPPWPGGRVPWGAVAEDAKPEQTVAVAPPRVAMLATDLDGTLLDRRGRVSERTVAAIAAARAAGLFVVPATARTPCSMHIACDPALVGPLAVCSNGGVVYDVDRRQVLNHRQLSNDLVIELITTLRAAHGELRFAIEVLDELIYEVGTLSPHEVAAWGFSHPGVGDLLHALDGPATKLGCWIPGLAGDQAAAFASEVIGAGVVEITSAGASWALISPLGVTKAAGLALAAEALGIAPDQVMAVGDEHNDLPMLAWAGTAAAVANACPEVLAAADWVIGAHHEDAVAELLESLCRGPAEAGAAAR